MEDRYGVSIEKDTRIQDLLTGNIYTVTGIDDWTGVATVDEQGNEGPYVYNTDIYYIVVND